MSSRGVDALNWGLKVAGLRHQAVAQNLANLSTPGYKRVTVSFDRALQGSLPQLPLATPHPGHLSPGTAGHPSEPRLEPVSSSSARPDGNNVDLEYELAVLSENTLHHQALLRQLNQRLAALRLAISEGRK
ncbi:MAG: flagellar basal body rod protein FlgB [bacterium]|nr:flagellar basal body rod protein FlgB [bacterium]